MMETGKVTKKRCINIMTGADAYTACYYKGHYFAYTCNLKKVEAKKYIEEVINKEG